ncbi:MAG TPA: 16S rRNA (cytosine(1402)-N(4))-methyltransferase RsmH [Bacteroidia bacterium]|nr:16S rRNA (cytosine(1402)-N(4))-methyltransferase RsmH [Bacteroidia bacterium]
MYHRPALLEESIEGLKIKENGTYVDATFGGGGHANAILERLKNGKLFVFDQDTEALKNSKNDKNLYTIHSNFRFMREQLNEKDITKVDGIIADLGVSSHQIDTPERGFSTRFDAPLDMRMNTTETQTAADIINSYSVSKLTLIFSEYGEIANSHKLAQAIGNARASETIHTTGELIEAIKECTPAQYQHKYLAKVFQALRLELNQEMDALKDLLKQSADLLNVGGRLVVISYHSLEDRLVKNYMRAGNFEGIPQKNMYGHDIKPFNPLTRKPIIPSEKEIETNSRARSAKLRIAERLA